MLPQRLLTGKFLLTYREKKDNKKGKRVKIEKERRKIVKGRWKSGNVSRKSYKKR